MAEHHPRYWIREDVRRHPEGARYLDPRGTPIPAVVTVTSVVMRGDEEIGRVHGDAHSSEVYATRVIADRRALDPDPVSAGCTCDQCAWRRSYRAQRAAARG